MANNHDLGDKSMSEAVANVNKTRSKEDRGENSRAGCDNKAKSPKKRKSDGKKDQAVGKRRKKNENKEQGRSSQSDMNNTQDYNANLLGYEDIDLDDQERENSSAPSGSQENPIHEASYREGNALIKLGVDVGEEAIYPDSDDSDHREIEFPNRTIQSEPNSQEDQIVKEEENEQPLTNKERKKKIKQIDREMKQKLAELQELMNQGNRVKSGSYRQSDFLNENSNTANILPQPVQSEETIYKCAVRLSKNFGLSSSSEDENDSSSEFVDLNKII